MSIDRINGLNGLSNFITDQGSKTTSKDFQDIFNEALSTVTEAEKADEASNLAMLAGEGGTLHGTLIEAEKADIALQLTLEIRNKVVDAYKEIMTMQI